MSTRKSTDWMEKMRVLRKKRGEKSFSEKEKDKAEKRRE
jgi:hypothetical protein